MAHSWNLFKWMDALGIRRKDQPEIVHAIQPVEIVGDHRAFASPILAPAAWAGGSIAAVIAISPAVQIRCGAPGGTAIREFALSLPGVEDWEFRITQTPLALGNVVTPLVQDMAPDPTTSVVRGGTVVAGGAAGSLPIVSVSNVAGFHRVIVDSIFIRPGWWFEAWGVAANKAADFAVYFEDFPAPRAEP